jgi:hypothetical protein
MRKNVGSQHVGAVMVGRTDGAPLTSAVSVYVTGDGGTQTAGSGTLTHEGNGQWDYVPTAGETNYDHVLFLFTHASGVYQAVNVYPTAANPSDSVRLGLTALPNAAADAAGGLPISDAGGLDLDARLDAAVSSRLAAASYTAPLDAAGTRAAVGLASANLDTQLSTIAGYIDTEVAAILAAVDTEVAAIKAKTDQLVFTGANKVDAAIIAAADFPAVVREAVADALLGRAIQGGTNGGRSVTSALRKLRNRVAIAAGVLTVYAEDDTSPDHTEAVTTAAGDPIIETDPA